MRKIIFFGTVLLTITSCQQKSTKVQSTVKTDTVVIEKIVYRDKEETNNYQFKTFDCYDGNQTEMNQCSYEEYLYCDSIMKLEYNILLNKFSEPDQKDIRESIINSQKAWEKSLNANAQYISELYHGGTIRPMAVNTAKISDIKVRIDFLRNDVGF